MTEEMQKGADQNQPVPTEIKSISDLAGILTKGDPVAELLEERRLDTEREEEKFRKD